MATTSQATSSALLSIFHTFDPVKREALSDLTLCFEGIDAVVHRELKNPHSIRQYRKEDQEKATSIFTKHEQGHDENEMLSYLGDRSFKPCWVIAFESLLNTLEGYENGRIYARPRIFEIEALTSSLDIQLETVCCGQSLPRYVIAGIKERISCLQNFVHHCNSINHKQELVDMFSQRKRVALPQRQPQQMTSTRASIIAWLRSDNTAVGITYLVIIISTTLAVTAYKNTRQKDFNLPDLYNYLQAFLISTLALSFNMMPLLQDGVTGKYAGEWVTLLGTASILTGALAPALFPIAGSGWCNLLAFISSACQAGVSLHLLKALKKADLVNPSHQD